MTGVKTTFLDTIVYANEILANSAAGTGRISLADLATQLAAEGTIATRLDGVETIAALNIFSTVGTSVDGLSVEVDEGALGLVLTANSDGGVYKFSGASWAWVAPIPKILTESSVAERAEASAVVAGASADRAEVEAAGAATSASSAASSYALTTAARDQVVALSQANAFSHVYATKALANAALSGLSSGATVLVLADESRGNVVAAYHVSGGAFVFVALFPARKTVYLDPVAGSDSNSGLSQDAPFASLSVAAAKLALGDTLLIAGGSRIHQRIQDLPDYVTLGRYGHGEDPIIDGSRKISAASWTSAGGGVWYADVTHETITSNDGTAAATRYCMWSEWGTGATEADLVPYWSGADISANIAYIAAGDHIFTCHRQGSTAKDPRSDSNSTQYRYYVCPPNGEDPSAGEITYYYGEYAQVVSLPQGAIARDMIWQRSAAKDLSGHNAEYIDTLERIRIRGASAHAWVGGSVNLIDCTCKLRRTGGDFDGGGGGGWHLYAGTTDHVGNILRCEADGFYLNYYTHSSGAAVDSQSRIRMKDCVSRNAILRAVDHSNCVTHGTEIDGLRSINDAAFVMVDDGTTITNSSYFGTGSIIGYSGPTGGTIDVENCTFITSGTDAKLAWNERAQALTDASHRCTIRMKNVTNVGGVITRSTYWRLCHYEFTDCILGDVYQTTFTSTLPWASITATNTQLNMGWKSAEEINAMSGAALAADCVLPTVKTTYTKTATSALLAQVSPSSRSVSGTSGSTTMTTNSADWAAVGVEFTITDYDGAGGTHKCRVTAVSGTTLTVSVAPDATFTNKAFTKSIWGKKLWPSGVTGVTAVFSDDGTQAYLSDVTGVSAGTWLWFGQINRRQPFGARKITALSGNTATLDRAVDWRLLNHSTLLYAPFGTTSGVTRPSVPVQFGFWLRSRPNGDADSTLGPQFAIDYASPLTGGVTGAENQSSGGVARFTSPTGSSTYYKTDGTSGSNSQIMHELGEINAGLWPIGVGDTVTLTAVCNIPEFYPEYASDPLSTGRAEIVPSSYLAGLGMGAHV